LLWPNNNVDSNQTPLALYACMTTEGGPLSTNLVTLTFVKMYGTNVDTGVSATGFTAANTFVGAFALAGSTNTIGSTNLTTLFQQGCSGLRLLKATTANSTTNAFVKILDIGISGFKP
jgi:hypothetical protein